MPEDQSSLDPFDENSDAEINDKRWKGLLYVFPLCYYWIIVFLLGEESRQKPKVFCNVSLSRYVFNGGFHLKKIIKHFFCGPSKSITRDLDFVDKLALLLEPENFTDDIMQKSKELSALHREYENTKARRRLEKWSFSLIVVYLLVVLVLILCNYFSVEYKGFLSVLNSIKCNIPANVMIVILSTTTVNIIGLGLIVLRGHFLANDKSKNQEDQNHSKNK